MLQFIGQKARGIATMGMKAMSSVGAGLALGSKVTGSMAGLVGALGGAAAMAGLSTPSMAASAASGIMRAHAGMSAANKISEAAGGVVSAGGAIRKSFLEK